MKNSAINEKLAQKNLLLAQKFWQENLLASPQLAASKYGQQKSKNLP
jgi:hypothetical protein